MGMGTATGVGVETATGVDVEGETGSAAADNGSAQRIAQSEQRAAKAVRFALLAARCLLSLDDVLASGFFLGHRFQFGTLSFVARSTHEGMGVDFREFHAGLVKGVDVQELSHVGGRHFKEEKKFADCR